MGNNHMKLPQQPGLSLQSSSVRYQNKALSQINKLLDFISGSMEQCSNSETTAVLHGPIPLCAGFQLVWGEKGRLSSPQTFCSLRKTVLDQGPRGQEFKFRLLIAAVNFCAIYNSYIPLSARTGCSAAPRKPAQAPAKMFLDQAPFTTLTFSNGEVTCKNMFYVE